MIEMAESSDRATDSRNRAQPPEYAPADMQSLVSASFCPMDYQVVPNPTSPMTGFSGIALGAIDVFRHEGVGKRVGNRNSVHIREQWVDDFVISMPIDAYVTTTQGGHIANLEPGGFVFLSTSRPFGAALSAVNPHGAFSAFLVRISGPLLREKVPHIDHYCGRANSIMPGAGQIMQSLFELAITDGAALTGEQRGRFGDMLLAAVVNVAAEVPDLTVQQPQRLSAHAQLRQQAMEYIHHHLSNPELDSRLIAAHCRISVRHLQAAFAASVTTVEAYIRESRLLQCRVSLKHPQLRNSAVIQIAMQWGFNDPAYFSRIYKARFGKPPSTDRN
jgi:AraC family transcriptional regulator, positive regulator of tynA and feaB